MAARSKSVENEMPLEVRAGVLEFMLDASNFDVKEAQDGIRESVKHSVATQTLTPMTAVKAKGFDDAFKFVLKMFRTRDVGRLAILITVCQKPHAELQEFLTLTGMFKSRGKSYMTAVATSVVAVLSEFRKRVMEGIPEHVLSQTV